MPSATPAVPARCGHSRLRVTITAVGLLCLVADVAWAQSTGIRRAEAAGGTAAGPPDRWVAAPATMRVGGALDAPEVQFSGIAGAVRLADGSIVVADGASSTLRVISARGQLLRTLAGKGSGPGEVTGFDGLLQLGDTLYALDERGGARLFATDGRFLRDIPYRMGPAADFMGPPLGVMHNSVLVGVQRTAAFLHGSPGLEMVRLRLMSPTDRRMRVLGTFPQFETFRLRGDRFNRDFGFSPQLLTAVFDDRVCVSYPESYAISCLDTLGREQLAIRRQIPPRVVTDSMRTALRVGMSGVLPGGGSRFQGSLRQYREREASTVRFRRHLPLLARLIASADQMLWACHYQPSDGVRSYMRNSASGGPTTCDVFLLNGALTATVTLPAGFRPYAVAGDWVLGVARDEDDVERVDLRPIVRRP